MMQIFEQSVSSGSNFDGTAPAGSATDVEGVSTWTIGSAGGLFDFGQHGPVILDLIQLTLGGQTTWTLTRYDRAGFACVLWSGATEPSWAALVGDGIYLAPGDTLKLVTTGTTTNNVKARLGVRKVSQ
jgi:hypothetical protein